MKGRGKGRKLEYPEKPLDDELQKMPHTESRKFKPQPRLEHHSSIGGRLGKQTRQPLHHASPQLFACYWDVRPPTNKP